MKKNKVLIVEDERIVALDLRAILTSAGFHVLPVVASGKQAITASKEFSPDIVLMDISLRGTMSGIDAAKTIIEQFDIPIIFLTANSDEKTLERAKHVSAYGYILKPFDERDVRMTVEMVLYKHRAESEVKEQRQWLSTTLHSIGDAVIATDKKGFVKFMNVVAEQLTGWTQKEAQGKKLGDIFIIENEDTGKRLPNPVAKVLRERAPLSLTNHTILIAKDGKRTFIEDSAAPIFDESGAISGVVLTFRDVTEKRRVQDELNANEKRFRALIENSAEVVLILDKDGSVLFSTNSIASILGYSLKDFLGQNIFSFIHPDEVDYNRRLLSDMIKQSGSSVLVQVRLKHKDRSWRWLEATGTNLLDDAAVNGIVVNFRDITYRKESEEKLNHLNRRLDLLARVTSEVIGALPIQKQTREMIDQVRQAFNVDAVVVRVIEDEKLQLLASIGIAEEQLGKVIPGNYGISQQIMTSRRALAIKNVQENFATLFLKQESGLDKKKFDFISYAGAPLLIGHTVIGIIGLFTKKEMREFSSTDLEHLQIVANHISVAIANSRLFKEIREQNIEMTKHIEEQNRTEKLLRDSEERYRDLVEHSPSAIIVHFNGQIQFVNHAAVTLFGASVPGELIGKKILEVIHPDYRDEAVDRMMKVYDNFILPTTEQRYLRLDGTPIDVEISSIPFTFEGKAAAQVIARDITERKQNEMALLESELRFRSLFENAKDAVFLADTKTGKIIDVNAEAEKLLQYPRTEIIGKHQAFLHPVHRAEEAKSLFREQMLTLGEHPIEFEVVDSKGNIIPVEIKASAIRLDDNRIISQGIFRDISERKIAEHALRESEEKYRRLFEESKDGIYISTIDGKIVDVNTAMMEMLGFDSKADMMNHNTAEFYYYEKEREKFVREFETKDFVKDYEITLRVKNGSKVHVLITAVVVRDANGKPILFNGSMRNISEKKQLEQQLLQAQKLESIGTLAGGIAHDFNNLLAMILGTAELIKRHAKDNPAIQTYINRIIEASERGSSISKQLLLFARPEQAELQPISVHGLLESVTEFLSHFLPKTITIHYEQKDDSTIIMGDEGHLHQALLNLSINARDAMPNGGVLKLGVKSVRGSAVQQRFSEAEEHEYAAIFVQDSGDGMDDEVRHRIFEPFFSTKERGKGTGLGLAIVHGIVQLHRGFIDVRSAKGVGTTFTLYFPLIAVEQSDEQPHHEETKQMNTETILIVDDEEILREILVESLREEGYSILSASNGVEAIQTYTQNQQSINLVITDLGMPRMGGEELFGKLQAINRNVKVIVSSGYLDSSTKSELLKKGIKDVLTKPYRFDLIFSTVRNVLDMEQ